MTKELYLKDIAHALKVSRTKKKNIIKELSSEIDCALENGEELLQIISRMGDASEVAADFNENLLDDSLHTPHKPKLILLFSAVFFLIIAGIFTITHIFNTKTVTSKSEYNRTIINEKSADIARLLSEGKYASIINDYCDATLTATGLESKDLKNAYQQLSTNAGLYTGKITTNSFSEISDHNGEYAVHIITAKYSKRNIVYTLSFNKESKLVGLYMR